MEIDLSTVVLSKERRDPAIARKGLWLVYNQISRRGQAVHLREGLFLQLY